MNFIDFVDVLGKLHNFCEYLSWKVLCPSFFVTSVLLLLEKISRSSIILTLMNETTRMIIGWTWILSTLGISYRIIVSIIFRVVRVVQARISERERERLKQERQDEAELRTFLSALYPKEKRLLKYILEKETGAIWLPLEDATVLSLQSKKCIYPIWNASSLRGNFEGGTAQCFVYALSSKLEGKREVISEIMREISPSEDYDKYN